MRSICRGCSIVALDALDQAGVTRYISRFYRALGSSRRFARIVGVHNYSDTNRANHAGRARRRSSTPSAATTAGPSSG
jgi:hypothetical protein